MGVAGSTIRARRWLTSYRSFFGRKDAGHGLPKSDHPLGFHYRRETSCPERPLTLGARFFAGWENIGLRQLQPQRHSVGCSNRHATAHAFTHTRMPSWEQRFHPMETRSPPLAMKACFDFGKPRSFEEIESYPPTLEAMFRLGTLRISEDRYEEAVAHFRHVARASERSICRLGMTTSNALRRS